MGDQQILNVPISEAHQRLFDEVVKRQKEFSDVVEHIVERVKLPSNDELNRMLGLLEAQKEPLLMVSADLKFAQNTFSAALESVSDAANQFQDQIAQITKAFDLTGLAKRYQDLVDYGKRIEAERKQMNENLISHHFFLFPYLDDFPYSEVHKLASLNKQEIIGFFNSFFSEEKHKHLKNLFKKQSHFEPYKRRSHIIETAIQAHIKGWYCLTIPTLVPIIENICLDFFELKVHRSLGNQLFYDPKKVNTNKENKNARRKRKQDEVKKEILKNYDGEPFIQALFQTFGIYEHDSDIFPKRNDVSHGRQAHYDKEISSLICFFMINFLIGLYQFKQDDEENKNTKK